MSGRLVWITGASSGIGRATALELAKRGDRVIASARSGTELDELARSAAGILPWPIDVTDGVGVQAMVAAAEAAHGPIDVALLNAGTHAPVNAADFTAEGLRALCELNLFGTANCLETSFARMMPRGRGRIVVMSSSAGFGGLPTAAYYAASKAALTTMVEALRFDAVKAGIVLQIVHPGFVDTPLTKKNSFKMPFLLSPAKAARRIASGMERDGFEIAFPRRLVWPLKLARLLPYPLYFALMSRITRK